MIDVTSTITFNGTAWHAQLGTIEHASLGYEDHGFFTSMLDLGWDGGGQGFGGMVLGKADGSACSFLTELWVKGVMRVADVQDWERVKGSRVYILRKQPYGMIEGLASADGKHVFLAQDITDAANRQREDFNTQHELGLILDDLRRVQRDIEGNRLWIGSAIRKIDGALAHLSETDGDR